MIKKSRLLLQVPCRSFYFTALADKNFPDLDFPLNVGFNENFKDYSQRMSTMSKLKLLFRRRQLEALFLSHYRDLLRAIKAQNYDQLELLCEDNLTQALAAKVYELCHIKKYRIEIGDSKPGDHVKVMNHFFIKNVNVDRARNLCLSRYTIEPDTRASVLTYLMKPTSYEDVDMTRGT